MNDEKEVQLVNGLLYDLSSNGVHVITNFHNDKRLVDGIVNLLTSHGKAMFEKGRNSEINKQLADDMTYDLSEQSKKDADMYEENQHLKSRIAELEQRMIDQANMIAKKENEIAELERSRT